jgi:hypothetical protein
VKAIEYFVDNLTITYSDRIDLASDLLLLLTVDEGNFHTLVLWDVD